VCTRRRWLTPRRTRREPGRKCQAHAAAGLGLLLHPWRQVRLERVLCDRRPGLRAVSTADDGLGGRPVTGGARPWWRLSGAVWESPPDGGPGWRPQANAAGWPVYVVDAVDAGRAGRAPDSWRQGQLEWKTAEQVWSRFRIGAPDGWSSRRRLPGQQFPVDQLDARLAAHLPRRRTTDTAETAALVEALASVGRCHVLAYSHGASLIAEALPAISHHVDRVVLVEPLPMASTVSGALPPRVLLLCGDHTVGHELWGPQVDTYQVSGATRLCLPQKGVTGNSHVPMSESNSDVVLDLALEWLGDRSLAEPGDPSPPTSGACRSVFLVVVHTLGPAVTR